MQRPAPVSLGSLSLETAPNRAPAGPIAAHATPSKAHAFLPGPGRQPLPRTVHAGPNRQPGPWMQCRSAAAYCSSHNVWACSGWHRSYLECSSSKSMSKYDVPSSIGVGKGVGMHVPARGARAGIVGTAPSTPSACCQSAAQRLRMLSPSVEQSSNPGPQGLISTAALHPPRRRPRHRLGSPHLPLLMGPSPQISKPCPSVPVLGRTMAKLPGARALCSARITAVLPAMGRRDSRNPDVPPSRARSSAAQAAAKDMPRSTLRSCRSVHSMVTGSAHSTPGSPSRRISWPGRSDTPSTYLPAGGVGV